MWIKKKQKTSKQKTLLKKDLNKKQTFSLKLIVSLPLSPDFFQSTTNQARSRISNLEVCLSEVDLGLTFSDLMRSKIISALARWDFLLAWTKIKGDEVVRLGLSNRRTIVLEAHRAVGFSFFFSSLFFFLVLSCSCWLSLKGFDFGFFLLWVLLDVFLLLCMEYVLAIGIFCFEGAEPSSVMAERERERRV